MSTLEKIDDLWTQLASLAPLCEFDVPTCLCITKTLFMRRRYIHLDEELTRLVDSITVEGE